MMAKKAKKPQRGGARPGSGRPRVYENLSGPVTTRVELKTLFALDRRAEELGITRSAAVQQAIVKWLEK